MAGGRKKERKTPLGRGYNLAIARKKRNKKDKPLEKDADKVDKINVKFDKVTGKFISL